MLDFCGFDFKFVLVASSLKDALPTDHGARRSLGREAGSGERAADAYAHASAPSTSQAKAADRWTSPFKFDLGLWNKFISLAPSKSLCTHATFVQVTSFPLFLPSDTSICLFCQPWMEAKATDRAEEWRGARLIL